jgi:hypothetical protein
MIQIIVETKEEQEWLNSVMEIAYQPPKGMELHISTQFPVTFPGRPKTVEYLLKSKNHN